MVTIMVIIKSIPGIWMQAKMVYRKEYYICVGFGTHTSDIDDYVYGKIEKY